MVTGSLGQLGMEMVYKLRPMCNFVMATDIRKPSPAMNLSQGASPPLSLSPACLCATPPPFLCCPHRLLRLLHVLLHSLLPIVCAVLRCPVARGFSPFFCHLSLHRPSRGVCMLCNPRICSCVRAPVLGERLLPLCLLFCPLSFSLVPFRTPPAFYLFRSLRFCL